MYFTPILMLMAVLPVSHGQEVLQVPVFHESELSRGGRDTELWQVLGGTGLLSVAAPVDSQALNDLCKCRNKLEHVVEAGGILNSNRATLATATMGTSPLPLTGPCALPSLEKLRDTVADASEAFVAALDRLVPRHGVPVLRNRHGGSYQTVTDVIQSAQHLEHFHVYSKSELETIEEGEVLPFHTDAGLFLAFVPGIDCESLESAEDSLLVKDGGVTKVARFAPGTVGILLGIGAEEWLSQSEGLLRATHHSVQMAPGQVRAWYGKMHLVSPESIIDTESQMTFGDLRKQMVLSKQDVQDKTFPTPSSSAALGCETSELPVQQPVVAKAPRRRLHNVEDPSECNNDSNFFCWMSCLDIPDRDNAQNYAKEGYGLYCMDPSISSSVEDAVKPCTEGGVIGLAINTNCIGVWRPTDPNVTPVQIAEDFVPPTEEPFCYGKTSMYMDGFNWIGSTCALYLFQSWVLDSRAKLIGACFGSILFGAMLEGVIYIRRLVVPTVANTHARLLTSALSYGFQLTLAYCVMLVIMIYSGPLFLSVIAGLMVGHVLFNAKDAWISTWWNNRSQAKQEEKTKGDCCCIDYQDEEEPGTTQQDTTTNNNNVPEGSTPCCQHLL